MQSDGNFVIYGGSGAPISSTDTHGHPGAYLRVNSDGNVVIYSTGGGVLWQTGTWCR